MASKCREAKKKKTFPTRVTSQVALRLSFPVVGFSRYQKNSELFPEHTTVNSSRGGGYSHTHAIWVCAAVKGMAFKLFSLG